MSDSQPRCPLSVVFIARNEADNIERAVRAATFADEVVVVDDHSTDDTVARAVAAGARVLTHKFTSFASQRNWALQEGGLRHEWVLCLDADEVITPELERALRDLLTTDLSGVAGFRMCRKTMLFDKWLKYSDGFPVWIVRLVHRGRMEFADRGHGEVPIPTPREGRIATLREPFLHFAFSKGLDDWFARHNRYSTREAELELAGLKPLDWSGLVSLDAARQRDTIRQFARRLPCRPLLRFLYQYVWRWGFLDGSAGYTFCFLMAAYEGMIVAKRRERSQPRSAS